MLYREEHRPTISKEKWASYSKKYYTAHKEQIREYVKSWRLKNKHGLYAAQVKRSTAKSNHGLSAEDYESLLKGSCAICGLRTKKMSIDHNHKTSKYRAVLCHNCNVGLGHFKDNPALLVTAMEYLYAYN